MEQPADATPPLPVQGGDPPSAAAPADVKPAGGTSNAPGPEAADPSAVEGPGATPAPSEEQEPFQTEMPKGIDPELAQRIDAIAPRPPMTVRSQEQIERWEVCARTAAAMALHQADADPELDVKAQREWAWHAARTFYESDTPTGAPVELGKGERDAAQAEA